MEGTCSNIEEISKLLEYSKSINLETQVTYYSNDRQPPPFSSFKNIDYLAPMMYSVGKFESGGWGGWCQDGPLRTAITNAINTCKQHDCKVVIIVPYGSLNETTQLNCAKEYLNKIGAKGYIAGVTLFQQVDWPLCWNVAESAYNDYKIYEDITKCKCLTPENNNKCFNADELKNWRDMVKELS